MSESGNESNNPFQKGNPFRNKNYNKLFWHFSLAVLVFLLLGILFIYVHGRHL